MNAVAIAQKIPKYNCCIVMFSVAQHHARQTSLAYCARSGGGKSFAMANNAMKTKTPIAK